MLCRMCGGRREALHKAGSSRFAAQAQDDSCPLRGHDAIPPKRTHRSVFHSHSVEQASVLPDKPAP